MVLSKLDLAIVAAVAAALFWVEYEHRIIIATPAAAEAAPAGSICPEKDSVPFSADCLAFIEGGAPVVRDRTVAAEALAATTDAPQAACPASNENGPYSARCLKFMSGWYWHPNPAERTP
jgi:hypothetical protein